MLILTTATVSGSLSPELQRLNYGVVFEPGAQIHLSRENWIHTFEVQLPDDFNLIRLSGCTIDKNTCSVVNDILLEINQIRHETELTLNHTVQTIKSLVPERQLTNNGRNSRSILPFVGDLSKTLFGTATFEDVQIFAKHINALNKLTTNVVKTVQQHENDMSSYIKTVDERITNVVSGIKENEIAITHIQSQLFESFDNLERSFTAMSLLLTKQIEKSRKLETRLHELIQGVYELVEGKLSPHLIPPQTLSKSINDIQSILNEKYQDFYLTHTDPKDLYKKVHTIFTRNSTSLYISVKFPISPYQEPLTMFKILSFPVPLNETSNHATHLVDLPDILAVTSDLTFYTTLTSGELTDCSKRKIITCRFNKILRQFTQNSCELALFKNDKTLIRSMCDFRVSLDHVSEQITKISNTEILIYKTKFIEFDCENGKRIEEGCDFCIMTVPCKCSMSTTNMFLPPRLSGCYVNTTNKIHPVNLALLQQFFNDSALEQVNGNSLFESPLNVKTPTFKVYNHSMSNIIADDRKAHLSLQKMAKAAADDAQVFQSLTDPLLSGDISLNNDWPNREDFILYVTSAVAAFSFVAFIMTFLKLRKVLIIVSGLQKAKAATLPSFVYQGKTTTEPSPKFFLETVDIGTEHLILAICICILFCLVILTVYTIKCKSQKTFLLAEVTNGKSCVHVPLQTLNVCPTYWTIQSPSEVKALTARGKISPSIEFEWDKFTIQNKLTDKTIEVDTKYSMSYLQGRKLRKILKTTYSIHFFVQHENLLVPIN